MKFYDPTGNPIDSNLFVETYSKKYFADYPNNRKYNDEKDIVDMCTNGKFDFKCVAWKIGRDYDEYHIKYEKGEAIPNGYGNLIDGGKLKEFLIEISNNQKLSLIFAEGDFSKKKIEEAFKILSAIAPPNFGTVYIITVMYFLSKGKIPIYDQFAHKAIKAILFEKKPSAPVKSTDKTSIPEAPYNNEIIKIGAAVPVAAVIGNPIIKLV